MGFVYFVLIYNWLSNQINTFGMDLMANLMTWASGIALVLVTLWIMIQGYRMITGQSRDSMMALVMSMTRVAIIVTAAITNWLHLKGRKFEDIKLVANGAGAAALACLNLLVHANNALK